MKKLLLLVLLSGFTYSSEVDDLFQGGEDQFAFEKYSNEEILLQIDKDVAVSCRRGLCTLFSSENRFGGFEVGFNLGQGGSGHNGGGSGVNIYTGGYGDSEYDGEYWGLSAKYYNGKCTKKIKVPKSVYIAINRYMYGLLDNDGSTRRGFTPADEAMILFYSTIIDKADGCSSNR